MKPALKAPKSERLKLTCDELLSTFAFNFNLRRYTPGVGGVRRAAGQRLGAAAGARQGLTLVHFSAQPKPFWSHLPVSPCLRDWGIIMHPTQPTKCAYVEPRSGQV